MDWRSDVLSEIGLGMGVEGVDFSGTGVVSFEFERRGTLYMELQETGILMYLIRPVSQFEILPVLERALIACHYTKSLRFPLQVGLQDDDQLFISLFVANEGFNRSEAEGAMQQLTEKFDEIDA